jgi:hypothetical protein
LWAENDPAGMNMEDVLAEPDLEKKALSEIKLTRS